MLVPNSNTELIHTDHRARLKEIFKELVVDNCSSGFNFDDITGACKVSICLKGFLNSSVNTIKHRDRNKIIAFLAFLDCKTKSLQPWTDSGKHLVAF